MGIALTVSFARRVSSNLLSRERRGPSVQPGMTVNSGPSVFQELPDLLGPRERTETR